MSFTASRAAPTGRVPGLRSAFIIASTPCSCVGIGDQVTSRQCSLPSFLTYCELQPTNRVPHFRFYRLIPAIAKSPRARARARGVDGQRESQTGAVKEKLDFWGASAGPGDCFCSCSSVGLQVHPVAERALSPQILMLSPTGRARKSSAPSRCRPPAPRRAPRPWRLTLINSAVKLLQKQ